MKRSRIFLGITTALLAIAGVAAAKAKENRSIKIKAWFYTRVNPNHLAQTCPYFALTRCTKNGTGSQCYYQTALGTNFPYYTRGGIGIGCSITVSFNPF